ncbi:MAG: alpha/beta hydrolase [Verrucomicrobia bacterium]|nr:alpha/beta hydrolase [Verrucomicrobiota bacterium]MCH8527875.1 alpha/beta hydrolase [Kiritimatiellia bacterium]
MYKATLILLATLLKTGLLAQVYYPDSIDYGNPTDQGLSYKDVFFQSSDGTNLHGWLIKGKESIGTIIHFHGNAQNISSHFQGISWLANEGFDLFVFDYRGYGRSEGNPTREGVFQDCDAAVRKAMELQNNKGPFILYGQSLGAANALALAGNMKYENISGVIAEASFYSYKMIAYDMAGMLGYHAVSDLKSPHLVVGEISPVPVLFVHGTADQVIPYKHSQALFDMAKEPKQLLTSNGAGHLTVFSKDRETERERLLDVIMKWLEPVGRIDPEAVPLGDSP